MGVFNPLKVKMNHRGQMVDKYGREMTYSSRLHKRARKLKRVWPSYHALKFHYTE